MTRSVKIGVTGGSGAGKSLLLAHWKTLGATVLSADDVYHDLLETCEPMRGALIRRFGTCDRASLRGIVFHDAGALSDLNAITHPAVLEAIRKRSPDVVEAIYLIESGFSHTCTATLGIIAPPEVRVRRITARDGLSREQALARIASQQPDAFYIEHCGHVIRNDGAEADLFRQADAFWERVME